MNELDQYYLDVMEIQTWIPQSTSTNPGNPWQNLQQQVAQCHACDLAHSRTQTVFGVGDQQADLLIVGEAPGFHEDQQGEPFVGKAGQLLTEMLKSIGMRRDEVYIANILKCRPPENRNPQIEEVRQCTPFLEKQVELLQPKLILAVGRFAAHYLLDSTEPLSQLRQHEYRFRETNIPLVVSYHPAYLLRNPRDKAKSYQDLCRVKQLLQKV